jgi:hypothetical protein
MIVIEKLFISTFKYLFLYTPHDMYKIIEITKVQYIK